MTRAEYERLPKPPGGMWLKPMQEMADELKDLYTRVELEGLPDPDVDLLMENQIGKATESMKDLKEWNSLDFLQYTYWAVMEEAEKMDALSHTEVKNEKERELRAEAMLRLQVLAAWLHAINRRIEALGGRIETA